MMRRIDRQAMALVIITLVADQLSKQLLLTYLMKAGGTIMHEGYRIPPNVSLDGIAVNERSLDAGGM